MATNDQGRGDLDGLHPGLPETREIGMPSSLENYLAGLGDEATRSATEAALADDDDLRRALIERYREHAGVPADWRREAETRGLAAARQHGGFSTHRLWAGLALAAAALLALGSYWLPGPLEDPLAEVLRGPKAPGHARLLLLEPAAGIRLSDPKVDLAFSPLPGALGYRAKVLDAEGEIIAEVEGTGSPLRVVVPTGVGRRYWFIEARLPSGPVTSEIRYFELAP